MHPTVDLLGTSSRLSISPTRLRALSTTSTKLVSGRQTSISARLQRFFTASVSHFCHQSFQLQSQQSTQRSPQPPSPVSSRSPLRPSSPSPPRRRRLSTPLPPTRPLRKKRSVSATKRRRSRSCEIEPGELQVDPLPDSFHDAIVAFARGRDDVFVKLDKTHVEKEYQIRSSLATFHQSSGFSKVDLFHYLAALCQMHDRTVAKRHVNSDKPPAWSIEDVATPYNEGVWRDTFCQRESANPKKPSPESFRSAPLPPYIESTETVMRLIHRVVTHIQRLGKLSDTVRTRLIDEMYLYQFTKSLSTFVAHCMAMFIAKHKAEPAALKKNELLEACICILADFIVYEASPVSGCAEKPPKSNFFIPALNTTNTPLGPMLKFCYDYAKIIDDVPQHVNTAIIELTQIFVLRSHLSSSTAPETVSAVILGQSKTALQQIVQEDLFWALPVERTLQQLKKLPKFFDGFFEYAFLVALSANTVIMREMFKNQDEITKMMLHTATRLLCQIRRDFLTSFIEIEHIRTQYPELPLPHKFVELVLSSGFFQRDLLSMEEALKNEFLECIDRVIMSAAKLVDHPIDHSQIVHTARQGPFTKFGTRPRVRSAIEDPREKSAEHRLKKGPEEEDARRRAVAFAAVVIGSLCKSVEDGSRDMSKNNALKALEAARYNSTRSLQRLWSSVYAIQRGVDKTLTGEVLMTEQERNHYTIVMEGIRRLVVTDPRSAENAAIRLAKEHKAAKEKAKADVDVDCTFPSVYVLPRLQSAVLSEKGHVNLDNDKQFLTIIQKAYKEEGKELLARYDPESTLCNSWIRLQRRNAYVGNAKDMLLDEDKTVGHKCSCVAGNPKEKGKGSENRIACSNDLCENRLTKVECVPGKCGAGSYCQNQRMQNLEYAKFKIKSFPGKGVGMVADEDISEGTLVGEYQGEVLDEETFKQRMLEYEGERHFYFMTLTPKLVIDASRKAQATRFLNHSCDPNAETQKWNAGGEPRVGIFAKKRIAKGEEITFDYGARSRAAYSAPCICGAKNCRGKLAAQENDSQPETASDVAENMEVVNNLVASNQTDRKSEDIEITEVSEKGRAAKDRATEVEKPDEEQASASAKRLASAQNGPSPGKFEAPDSSSRKKRRLSGEDARLKIIRAKISEGKSAMEKANSLLETTSKMRNAPTISQATLTAVMLEKLAKWQTACKPYEELLRKNRLEIPEEKPIQTQPSEGYKLSIPRKALKPTQKENPLGTARNGQSMKVSKGKPPIPPVITTTSRANQERRRPSRWGQSADAMGAKEEQILTKDGMLRYWKPLLIPVYAEDVEAAKKKKKKPKKSVFMPTKSKKPKRKIRPEMLMERRKVTKRKDIANDSMGEYSTASEAEPIFDDSDDEFFGLSSKNARDADPKGFESWNREGRANNPGPVLDDPSRVRKCRRDLPVMGQGHDGRDGLMGGKEDKRHDDAAERPLQEAMPDRRGEHWGGAAEPTIGNSRSAHPMADPYPNRDTEEPPFARNRHHYESANRGVRDPVDVHHGTRYEVADPYAERGVNDSRNGYDRQRFDKDDPYLDRGSAGRHGRMSYAHPRGQGLSKAGGPPSPFRGGRHADAPGRRRYSQGDSLPPNDQQIGDNFPHRDQHNFRNPQPGFDYRAGPPKEQPYTRADRDMGRNGYDSHVDQVGHHGPNGRDQRHRSRNRRASDSVLAPSREPFREANGHLNGPVGAEEANRGNPGALFKRSRSHPVEGGDINSSGDNADLGRGGSNSARKESADLNGKVEHRPGKTDRPTVGASSNGAPQPGDLRNLLKKRK